MGAQRQNPKDARQHGDAGNSPVGLYSLILFCALGATSVAHILTVSVLPVLEARVLPILDVEVLSQPINMAFAVVYAWILAGLTVCVFLLAWLRARTVGILLSVLAVILWSLGLRRHVRSVSILLYVLPLVASIGLFRIGLRYASGHVLPVFDPAQASQAFNFVRKHIWAAGPGGEILSRSPEKTSGQTSARRLLGESGGRPSFVFTGCDHAVAVADRHRIKGVRDPGLTFIGPDERVVQVLDIRPQKRSFSLTGRTQDGIQVRVRASVAFQVDAGRRRPKLGASMPFSKAAAFRAILAQSVEHESDERLRHALMRRLWDDIPPIKGEQVLRDIISRLDFDDLYGPYQVDGDPPRRRIARAFEDRLQAVLEPIGVQLLNVDLGNFEPVDPEIYLKRARNWQTEWIRRVMVRQAEGQVERLQILERARADARTELILDLGRQLGNLTESTTEVDPDTVLDQFLVVVEALMTRPQVRRALPKHTKDTLNDMREAVGE